MRYVKNNKMKDKKSQEQLQANMHFTHGKTCYNTITMRYFTLSALQKRFSTEEKCLRTIFLRKYPNGVTCKTCKKVTKHFKIRKRPCYSCSICGNHVYPLKGTIFQNTHIALKLWFYAIFLMTSTRAGISAKQVERQLGVNYRTAWRMMHQIRKLMEQASPTELHGTVEIDETYIGGRWRNRRGRWNHGIEGKQAVMGMVERGGSVIMRHVISTGKRALFEQIEKHIPTTEHLMTDDYISYKNLYKLGYKHGVINHSEGKYRKGDIYTQNIEGVWSHLKRGLTGVYRKVSAKHLQKYCEEFAFRYNNRHRPSEMFDVLLSQIS